MIDEPRQTTARPILNSIEAQLFVANIKSSCDFYTNKLGFGFPYRKPHTRAWLMQRAGNPGRTSLHGPKKTGRSPSTLLFCGQRDC
jgi:catechol 2,3-dioxygenase-like lactoylglutathione lyase family enzyme